MTPLTIADHLDQLAAQMVSVAVELDYYGGFDPEARRKSVELLGAADIARGWADALRCENTTSEPSSSYKPPPSSPSPCVGLG